MAIHFIVAFSSRSRRISPFWSPEMRQLIQGKTIMMDFETYQSRHGCTPIPNCFNIVISQHHTHSNHNNMVYIHDIREANVFSQEDDDIYVIGGPKLYQYYMSKVQIIHATIVEREFNENVHEFSPPTNASIMSYGERTWSDDECFFYRAVQYAGKSASNAYNNEQKYLDLVKKILVDGSARPDRTGVGTMSLFGQHLEFDIRTHVPFITTKTLAWRAVIHELLWFLRGSSDSKELEENAVNIWKGNTSRAFLDSRGLYHYAEGETGPLYGHALRKYGATWTSQAAAAAAACTDSGDIDGFDGCAEFFDTYCDEENQCNACNAGNQGNACQGYDQLENLINGIKTDPFSRRHVMTTFNPAIVDQCVLAPCHGIAIQFHVEELDEFNRWLSCQVYCRSSDVFLGLPFNIASYAVLTYLIAKKLSDNEDNHLTFHPKTLHMTLGDAHIYANHVTQSWTQVGRQPLPPAKLVVSDAVMGKDWSQITLSDFDLVGYISHPPIKAEMAI